MGREVKLGDAERRRWADFEESELTGANKVMEKTWERTGMTGTAGERMERDEAKAREKKTDWSCQGEGRRDHGEQ